MSDSGIPGPAAIAAAGDLPVPESARVELARLARRWHELPLSAAQAGMPPARAVVDTLAARCGPDPVPDLGPAVVMDQLAVLVWDAYADGAGDGIPELLAALRRELG